MAVRTNNLGEDGTGREPYSEIDEIFSGDSYVVRITAIRPYRTRVAGELVCHIDWHNVTAGTAGRYANTTLPAKLPADTNQRRYSVLRHFRANRGRGISTPSPVFP